MSDYEYTYVGDQVMVFPSLTGILPRDDNREAEHGHLVPGENIVLPEPVQHGLLRPDSDNAVRAAVAAGDPYAWAETDGTTDELVQDESTDTEQADQAGNEE